MPVDRDGEPDARGIVAVEMELVSVFDAVVREAVVVDMMAAPVAAKTVVTATIDCRKDAAAATIDPQKDWSWRAKHYQSVVAEVPAPAGVELAPEEEGVQRGQTDCLLCQHWQEGHRVAAAAAVAEEVLQTDYPPEARHKDSIAVAQELELSIVLAVAAVLRKENSFAAAAVAAAESPFQTDCRSPVWLHTTIRGSADCPSALPLDQKGFPCAVAFVAVASAAAEVSEEVLGAVADANMDCFLQVNTERLQMDCLVVPAL